jgi:hypothetical protein
MRPRTATALILATTSAQAFAGDWPPGSYDCVVSEAVGIHVFSDHTATGQLTPDPARFKLTLAPLDSDCGELNIAHTTVGIALRCTSESSTAHVGSALGGTLYQWAFPGQTFMNIQGTILLKLDRGERRFMWTFTTADYTSSYHGTCRALS